MATIGDWHASFAAALDVLKSMASKIK